MQIMGKKLCTKNVNLYENKSLFNKMVEKCNIESFKTFKTCVSKRFNYSIIKSLVSKSY